MKRLLRTLAVLTFSTALIFTSCTGTTSANPNDNQEKEQTNQTSEENKESDENKDSDENTESGESSESEGDSESSEESERTDIETLDTANASWAFKTYPLSDYNNKTVTIDFSADMKVENNTGAKVNLMWQVAMDGWPIVASHEFATGNTDWVTVKGTTEVTLGENNVLYLSTRNIEDKTKIAISLSKVKLTVTPKESSGTETTTDTWLSDSVPSLYETYKNQFDYVGLAVEYGNFGTGWGTPKELYYSDVQKGLKKHANTISLGNEFKPQFVFKWWGNGPAAKENFVGSNGVTTEVPTVSSLGGLSAIDEILTICKNNGLKMRGHVLLWHAQTDDAFFTEDYTRDGTLVSADVMDARLEWYVKTMLNHVAEWENTNNGGEHIIWAWDVINEVTSDGSYSDADRNTNDVAWLRTSGSKWYTIYNNSSDVKNYYTNENYKSSDYIINAFRFANKYAPTDIKLVYNDYGGLNGTTTSNKHKSQLRVADLILSHKNDDSWPTRLDAMGLQSHYSVKNSASAFETEIKDFIQKGLDVQITELDIATCESYNAETDTVGASGKQYNSVSAAYAAFFKVFLDNRKTNSANGVDSITIWGLNDESSWLQTKGQRYWIGDCLQYPLLFKIIDNVKTTKLYLGTEGESNNIDDMVADKKGTLLYTLPCYDIGDSFAAKPAFFSVIETAKKYGN
ncbi:MAG: endo-1,4-beta-xylanase [Treponema sp.]|nr:endo-1,4-beta-xylanase [Treponema sp.]